jgi:chloramphenicol O-acetyltransferase type A
MREIDVESWARREHFETFRSFHYPHFTMCAEVDVTGLLAAVEQSGVSVTAAIVYVLTRSANDTPEFRQRIRGDTVVEHTRVHPSTTILIDDDLFSFCTLDYDGDFAAFAAHVQERIAHVKESPTLAEVPGRDDLLYMTAIPWVSFTSFSHPIPSLPADSVPRLAWGKFHQNGDQVQMPLSVQGHHALIDGLHIARYYAAVNAYLQDPEGTLGEP